VKDSFEYFKFMTGQAFNLNYMWYQKQIEPDFLRLLLEVSFDALER